MAYTKKQIETIFSEICDKISKEGLSLRKVLALKDMPDAVTFYKWIDSSKSKIKRYARACELRADFFADEILEISDTQNIDAYLDDDGKIVIDGATVQRSKLKVDTRKWLMGKTSPKKYGDKVDLTVGLEDMKPLEIIIRK